MRITKDLLAGLMFLAFGGGAAIIAQGYNMGTLTRMGSGFFPTAVGVAIALLGLAVAIRALLKPDTSEPIATIEFRPVFFIGLAIVVFGFLIADYGVVAALLALIVIGRFAGKEGGPLEVALMFVVLSLVAWGIFVYGLNIRLQVWPW